MGATGRAGTLADPFELDGHEAVIHCAIDWPQEEGSEWEFLDVDHSKRLFEAAGAVGVKRVLYLSSVAVHRPFSGNISETSPISPVDAYGQTKAQGEQALESFADQFGYFGTSLRLGPVVGAPATPDASFKSDRTIERIAKEAQGGTGKVHKDGRQFLAASDAAAIVSRVMDHPNPPRKLLCVDPESTSWRSVAEIAFQILGSEGKIEEVEAREPEHNFDTALLQTLGLSISSKASLVEHVRYILKRM